MFKDLNEFIVLQAGVDRFISILAEYGVPATPRTRRGIDIDAGCGQLKAELLRKRRLQKVQDAQPSIIAESTEL